MSYLNFSSLSFTANELSPQARITEDSSQCIQERGRGNKTQEKDSNPINLAVIKLECKGKEVSSYIRYPSNGEYHDVQNVADVELSLATTLYDMPPIVTS